MLQNFKATNTVFYLLEVNEVSGQYYGNPLAKSWNGTSFVQSSSVEQAHKFDTKELAQKAANLQNTLNEMFGSTNRVYVVQGTTTNELFDAQGQSVQPDTIGAENTEPSSS